MGASGSFRGEVAQAQEEYRPGQSHLINVGPHLSQCKPLLSHCVLSCQIRGLELSHVNQRVHGTQGGLYCWDYGSPQSVWGDWCVEMEEESNHVVGLHHWLYELLWCKSEFFGHRWQKPSLNQLKLKREFICLLNWKAQGETVSVGSICSNDGVRNPVSLSLLDPFLFIYF